MPAGRVSWCHTRTCQVHALPSSLKMNDIPTVQASALTTAYTMPLTLLNARTQSPS